MTPSSNSSDQTLCPQRAHRACCWLDGRLEHLCPALVIPRGPGGLGALIAWGIADAGRLTLAFVFQTLSRLKPDFDTSLYAYARQDLETTTPSELAFGSVIERSTLVPIATAYTGA